MFNLNEAIGFLISNNRSLLIFFSLLIICFFLSKLINFIIRYILLKRLIKALLLKFDESDEYDDDLKDNQPKTRLAEDERLNQKNKHREELQEAERFNNVHGQDDKSSMRKKIVGLVNIKDLIIGRHTEREVMEKILPKLAKLQGVDPAILQEFGFNTAIEASRTKNSQGKDSAMQR